MKILITGGAGFIGSALIRYLITHTQHHILNVDKLTYAGNLSSLDSVSENDRYQFLRLDICAQAHLQQAINDFKPDAIMHLAAESHVDRSIASAGEFIQTNIVGTYSLLECARAYWLQLDSSAQCDFRFHHISTDEVYGDLPHPNEASFAGQLFSETTAYAPSSPYSASKAASDHLVRAWHRTYGLPVLITNCSNNYGPFHFPEKLIPLTILNALAGKSIPVYGDGLQIRDWLFVDDHVEALYQVVCRGAVGETYNIGGFNECTNLSVVTQICVLLNELAPFQTDYQSLITFVTDRAGHDKRYAIDAAKIANELNWQPQHTFSSGLRKTVQWYLQNLPWCQALLPDLSFQLPKKAK